MTTSESVISTSTQDSADYAKAAALPKNLNIFPMLEW